MSPKYCGLIYQPLKVTITFMAISSNADRNGRTLDADIRRLIRRYGADEVLAAIKHQTARPRGRRPEKDVLYLADTFLEDARIWLGGGNPFNARSNLSIARGFANERPGWSNDSTVRRIQRKLSSHRRYYMLVQAVWLTEAEYPFAKHLGALRELVTIGIHRELWAQFRDVQNWTVGNYRGKLGDPPADMTMQALGAASAAAAQPAARTRNFLHTLFTAQLLADFDV